MNASFMHNQVTIQPLTKQAEGDTKRVSGSQSLARLQLLLSSEYQDLHLHCNIRGSQSINHK